MTGRIVTWALRFVLFLPLNLFNIRSIFGLFGFLFGLLFGLVVGYFLFIFSLPDDVEDHVVPAICKSAEDEDEMPHEQKKRMYRLMPPWVSQPDIERISWLNRMVELMWPFIDKAVKAQVLEQVTPLIEQNKPKFVDSVEFEALSLGHLPPAIVGIKSIDTTDDEVIIQPQLRWCALPNVKLVARVGELKATVQVTHMSLEAVARITLKPLSNVFPCFSKITVSLMSPPKVDLGASALGLDPLALPFVSSIAQEKVQDMLQDMLLWPTSMEVYNEDPQPAVGRLLINNIRAKDLRNVSKGLVGTADPFVEFTFGKRVGNLITEVAQNELDPKWEKEGYMRVFSVEDPLLVKVYHKSKPRDLEVGACRVSIKGLDAEPGVAKHLSFQLEPFDVVAPPSAGAAPPHPAPSAGDVGGRSGFMGLGSSRRDLGTIEFDITWVPRVDKTGDVEEDVGIDTDLVIPKDVPVGGGVLRVILHQGEKLLAKSRAYDSPYVVLKFRNEEWQSEPHKTPDGEVEFNESIKDFVVKDDEGPSKDMLKVRVMSKAKKSSIAGVARLLVAGSEPVGHCEIPLKDVAHNLRINAEYPLQDSVQAARIKVELQWHEKKDESAG